jgi:hypothetical protein
VTDAGHAKKVKSVLEKRRQGRWWKCCGQYLTSLTSHVDDTTGKPVGCTMETASGDAIMMQVDDILCVQLPPSSRTASTRTVRACEGDAHALVVARATTRTIVHGIAMSYEYINGLAVNNEQLVHQLETHGFRDADTLAVNVQLDEELRGNEEQFVKGLCWLWWSP